MVTEMVVTIDGPSGTGKSTVTGLVAEALGLPHLDTGAFYRAAALVALESGADLSDGLSLASVLADVDLKQESGRTYLEGRDVSDAIRSPDVSANASAVAAHSEVRDLLVERQRDWVSDHGGEAVVEGRDIGSVVFPDAIHKVYLDARPEVRARRRALQEGHSAGEALEAIRRRDHRDSTREVSPLRVPGRRPYHRHV